ncbi:MAG: Flp pilus assembly protein CpaB [Chloroflexota bacterium]
MKRSNRLILLIGVFLAALAFVFVVILLQPGTTGPTGGEPTAPPAELDTVVAARDIPLGVTVTAAMVTTQKIKTDDREVNALGNPSQAIGKVARQTITRGQQITSAAFLSVSSPTSIECLAGFTCMAVQVDQVSGVGTLIKTGDYVDLVAQVSPEFPLTMIVDEDNPLVALNESAFTYDPTSVKVLLQGIQVVATLLPPPPETAAGAPTPAPDSGGTALTGQQEIVILAVTQQQAEVIKFVQLDGNITLTLRSPKDFVDANGNPIIPETIETTGVILKTMIDDFGVLTPEPILVPQPSFAP